MTELAVELSELRGYAALVARAADDCAAIAARARTDVADGDFGRILELVTYDYEALLPPCHQVLTEDGRRLDRTARTLHAVAVDLAETDHEVALAFGSRCRGAGRTVSSAFGDAVAVRLPHLDPVHVALPVVHLGLPFDPVCDLAVRVGLPDPRQALLQCLVGDLTKAMTQAAYWQVYADGLQSIRANLARGATLVGATWEGLAADRAGATLHRWLDVLDDQSHTMHDLGSHLRGMVGEAVEVGRTVIDLLRCFVSTMTAAWANAYLPGVGEILLVRRLREAWHLIRNAQRVLAMFWSCLRLLSDVLRTTADGFAVTRLPAAPGLPTR